MLLPFSDANRKYIFVQIVYESSVIMNSRHKFADFYKRMNNSTFGKTIKKCKMRWEARFEVNYFISQPKFHSSHVFENSGNYKNTKIDFLTNTSRFSLYWIFP